MHTYIFFPKNNFVALTLFINYLSKLKFYSIVQTSSVFRYAELWWLRFQHGSTATLTGALQTLISVLYHFAAILVHTQKYLEQSI